MPWIEEGRNPLLASFVGRFISRLARDLAWLSEMGLVWIRNSGNKVKKVELVSLDVPG